MAHPKRARNPEELELRSDAFVHGEPIPRRHTGDGLDVSPELEWNAPPPHTRELALLCEDPDAPQAEPWVHWIAYGIDPRKTHRLPRGVAAQGEVHFPLFVKQGRNSWDTLGYRGPLPPVGHGPHRYFFWLYALSAPSGLAPGASKEEFLAAIRDKVIAQAELIGLYER